MDITRIIAELEAERDRLDEIIVALERLHNEDGLLGTPKRRGRKFMDKSARLEVSERMKRYWAARRQEAGGGMTATSSQKTSASALSAMAAGVTAAA